MALPENILAIQSQAQLVDILHVHRVNTTGWGKDNTKSVENLFEELHAGEAALFLAADGLQKYITAVKVNVFYENNAGLYRLVEAAQNNFVTGEWRHRGLHNSLSEKRHALHGETPFEAARRALREEIGVDHPLALEQTAEIVHSAKIERDYSPLLTVNETQYFEARLRDEDYNPKGYIEEQATKRTFFHWEDVRAEAIK